MNRRDLLKYTLAIPVVGCVQQSDVYKLERDGVMLNPIKHPANTDERAPYDTDSPYYDEWLDDYGKDEMHLWGACFGARLELML